MFRSHEDFDRFEDLTSATDPEIAVWEDDGGAVYENELRKALARLESRPNTESGCPPHGHPGN
jgi:hypothetical protein